MIDCMPNIALFGTRRTYGVDSSWIDLCGKQFWATMQMMNSRNSEDELEGWTRVKAPDTVAGAKTTSWSSLYFSLNHSSLLKHHFAWCKFCDWVRPATQITPPRCNPRGSKRLFVELRWWHSKREIPKRWSEERTQNDGRIRFRTNFLAY